MLDEKNDQSRPRWKETGVSRLGAYMGLAIGRDSGIGT